MAWMNHGGFVFPVDPTFNGMTPSRMNNCVPVTVGVGQRVSVRVRVSVGVTVSVSVGASVQQVQQMLQVTAQPVQVWVSAPVGAANSLQQRINVTNEVSVGQFVATGSTLQEFAVSQSAVAVTLLATAAESGKLQGALAMGEMAREIAVNNHAIADLASDAGSFKSFALRLRQSGASAEMVKQGFTRVGFSSFDASKISEAFKYGDDAFLKILESLRASQQSEIVQEAQRILYQSANRAASQVCGVSG